MIHVNVRGQVLSICKCETLVSDSLNVIDIKFIFSEEWGGLTKTAQFQQIDTETKELKTYNVMVDEADEAMLPNEIKAGVVIISVFGVSGSIRMTTAPLAVPVEKSGFVGDGETPIPPTPDLYAQLLEEINAALGKSAEEIEKAVADYLEENPPEAGATAEEAAAIEANRQAIENMTPETIGAAAASHAHAWGAVTGKPETFPPAAHAHGWDEVSGKPASFPPASHAHTAEEVGARPSTWMPTAAEVGALPATYTPPVTSVNGQTGDVVIAAGGGSSTPGQDGEDGGYYSPAVDASGNLTWTPSKAGMPAIAGSNIKGPPGEDGQDGDDGVSPAVSVSKSGKITTITITDASGQHTATIKDGEDGQDGKTPVKGTDYFTQADKTEMVQLVLAALPNASGVSF